MAIFEAADLRQPHSKRWHTKLGQLVEASFHELFADPVGTWGSDVPHPVVAFYPKPYEPLLRAAGKEERFPLLCMRAKIFFALANGPARSVWGTVPRFDEEGRTRIVCGIFVERSSPEGDHNPHPERAIVPYIPEDFDWGLLEEELSNESMREALLDYLRQDSARWACVSAREDQVHERFRCAQGNWSEEQLVSAGENIQIEVAPSSSEGRVLDALAASTAAARRDRWASLFLGEERDLEDQLILEREGQFLDHVNSMIEALLPIYWPMVRAPYRPGC